MENLIWLIVVFVLGLCLLFYKHHHRMSLHNNVEQLQKVIERIFQQADKPVISQNRLIRGLKENLGVNEKMALKLIGQARKENFIVIDGTNVSLPQ